MNEFGIVDNSKYLKLAEDLKKVSEARKQRIAVELLEGAIKEFSAGTFSLAVLGMVKRGKSTFCNALLGADSDKYAPVGKTPVSNAITFLKKEIQKFLLHSLMENQMIYHWMRFMVISRSNRIQEIESR